MISKYLFIPLSPRNEFRADFSCDIDEIIEPVESSIKIDTGAMKTLIPLKTLGYSDKFCQDLKKYYLDNNYKYGFARGIERSANISQDLSIRKDIVFSTNISNLVISDYSIIRDNSRSVRVSCDTTGNILLGMDILKDFDFHCGLSKITGTYVFIGCLKSNITEEYLDALEEHFDYVPRSFKLSDIWRNWLISYK